jgi:protein TonB
VSPCATAEQALREAHPRTLRVAVALAVLIHAVAFVVVPQLSFEPYSLTETGPPALKPIDFVIAPAPRTKEVRKPPVLPEIEPADIADAAETIGPSDFDPMDDAAPAGLEEVRRDSFRSFDDPPVLVRRVEPVYPELARQAELEGEVGLLIVVSETGEVERAMVVRSVPGLDGAAVAAILQWRFEPARQRDVPVRVQIFQTGRFRLRG